MAATFADILALTEAPERPALPPLPPILGVGQRQGDVFVQPDPFKITRTMRLTATRLRDGQELVIVPEGNGHILRAAIPAGGSIQAWRWGYSNVVASVVITGPAYALLVQPTGPNPHAPLGIAPGSYVICRQVEPQILRHSVVVEQAVQSWQERHDNTFVID
jgi:hypothetical protein